MKLTEKQIDRIRRGKLVRVKVPEVNADCVIVRANVFEQMRQKLVDEWSDDERDALAARAMAESDLGGPIP